MFCNSNSVNSSLGLNIYRGAVLRLINEQKLEFVEDALILSESKGVSDGKIVAIGLSQELAAKFKINLSEIPINCELLMPALYDTHFHWVQDDVRDMPKTSLIEWLNLYTFPEEAKYANPEFAQDKAKQFWQSILSVGTIGGCCYSSTHEIALAEAFKYAPEDFYIGNVLMTMNCPDNL